MFLSPNESGSIESQAIYGAPCNVLKREGDWAEIETQDLAKGWVKAAQIAENDSYEKSERLRKVQSLFAHIYLVPDITVALPHLTLPYGAKILLDNPNDTGERWVSMELVSGEKAWIQKGDVAFETRPKTLEEILVLSRKFLGLPYTWGGVSSFGFDCSGFVQQLFLEMGLQLPRNSKDQYASDLLAEVVGDLLPGDLIFFGEKKISHVGLFLGDDLFIHATAPEGPFVRIGDLKTTGYKYQGARRIK